MIYWSIFALLFLFFHRLIYYIATRKEKVIMVCHKFKVNINSNEMLKFIGKSVQNNKEEIEYTISEDLLISNKRCHDLWNMIKENGIYKIKYYGINISFMDCNYMIIDIIDIHEKK